MQKNNYCLLCLKGKYFIINYLQEEQFELMSKCRRENKNTLVFANICFCFVLRLLFLFCFVVFYFI